MRRMYLCVLIVICIFALANYAFAQCGPRGCGPSGAPTQMMVPTIASAGNCATCPNRGNCGPSGCGTVSSVPPIPAAWSVQKTRTVTRAPAVYAAPVYSYPTAVPYRYYAAPVYTPRVYWRPFRSYRVWR